MGSASFATALRIAISYIVVAGLWIFFSDKALYNIAGDAARITNLQTLKGWGFVGLSATLIFGLVYWAFRAAERSENKLRISNEELAQANEEMIATDEELRQQFDELLANQDRINRQNACLVTLHETALALMNNVKTEEMLSIIVTRAVVLGEAPHGYVFLLTEDQQALELRVQVGDAIEEPGCRVLPGEGIIGTVWQSEQPLVIYHYQNWEGRVPGFDKLKTCIAIPLKAGGKVFGAFGINYVEDREISEEEFALLLNFAHMASIALENSLLQGRVRHERGERKKVEGALQQNQTRTQALIDALPDFIFRVSKDGVMLEFKQAVDFELSVDMSDKIGQNVADFLKPEVAQKVQIYSGLALETRITQRCEYAIEINGKLQYREMRFVATGEDEAIGIVRDITDSKLMEDELKYVNIHDRITGLYNRAYFDEELRRLNDGRYLPVGIIVCDINGLKLVNDSLGHEIGDQLLVGTAKLLKRCFRESDVVARIGGDEFAVILPESDRNKVEQATRCIRDAVIHYSETAKIPLSIALGGAVRTRPSESTEDIFKLADDHMYREKLHLSESARSALVNTLAKALEARDFVTDGHADRLQNLVEQLAIAAGLPENELPDIRLLGRFHDIGKVGIPDNILFKPGRLTGDEFEIMKRHCEIGHRIAQASLELRPIADWILKHQEWWNGMGYPIGLAGKDIPLACRILSVVDAYDAMTNDRPYRKAMTQDEAVAELKRCANIQFDPDLVEKFEKLICRH